MIKRYSDHAANERTFLAWVRTAIAVMAYGFLVERFDLFIRFASRGLVGSQSEHSSAANTIGILFVVMGMATMVIAAVRFFRTARQIDAEEVEPGPGVRFDFALVILLVLLGCSLLLYLLQAVL